MSRHALCAPQASVLGHPPARVAYLDLAAAPPKPALGLADVGPAACLAGELTLLPGIMAAPAQVLPQPHRCSSLWLLKSRLDT